MARMPMPIPPEVRELAGDVDPDLFDDAFRAACERLDVYIGRLAAELAQRLALDAATIAGVDDLFAARRWDSAGKLAVTWLLETLELYGGATRAGAGWRVAPAQEGAPSAELRAEAERLLPSARPAYEVLSLCAAALPAVLRGELRGEDALFGPSTLHLWFEYFSNANPLYAPNNEVAAYVAARLTPPGAAVFEFGGGAGSAAEALVARLSAASRAPARYAFTEPQPAFLRRGSRRLRALLPPECELSATRYDINLGGAEQGFEDGRFDLAFGVNTLHLAHALVPCLSGLRRLLRPGGVLVAGELIRPAPDAPVHLELPFTLLEDYRRTPSDDGLRARPGFVSAQGWLRALAEAGFHDVRIVPAKIEACAAIYPGFYCGALAAVA
ncbi:MAG TPA: class I SAM-dependent methyltransferase [Thermoanaerobaculaceae bacterium]|nr:class I SAM-dependent methyltransferase [Thermoanaerobaculaceae bacterium]